MQYWVHISGVQRGPMQIEELIRMGITAETYIWREGLADWVQAREVPELAGFFIVPGAENDAQQDGGDFVVGEQPAAGNLIRHVSRYFIHNLSALPCHHVRQPTSYGQSSSLYCVARFLG